MVTKSYDKKDKQKGQRSQVGCKREDCEFEGSREGLNEKIFEKRLKKIRRVSHLDMWGRAFWKREQPKAPRHQCHAKYVQGIEFKEVCSSKKCMC